MFIDDEEVENFCGSNNLVYYETSEKDGKNIKKCLKLLKCLKFKDVVVEGKVFESENYSNNNLLFSSIINDKK